MAFLHNVFLTVDLGKYRLRIIFYLPISGRHYGWSFTKSLDSCLRLLEDSKPRTKKFMERSWPSGIHF